MCFFLAFDEAVEEIENPISLFNTVVFIHFDYFVMVVVFVQLQRCYIADKYFVVEMIKSTKKSNGILRASIFTLDYISEGSYRFTMAVWYKH